MSIDPSLIDYSGDDTIEDQEIQRVVRQFHGADADGSRAAKVFRETFDQLYDGQRTGRYKWDQLFKTEKTHYGTLIEINLRRQFADILEDGAVLDYQLDGIELDCKYSFKFGGWMIPPEALNHLLLVGIASDEKSEWALGVVRATPENLRPGTNRDGKTGLNTLGRSRITWIQFAGEMLPNVLLTSSEEIQDQIMTPRSGQARVNQLFRLITNRRIGRNTVATVAQQDDYMKRVRDNGGARGALAKEGFLIPGGDYAAHREVAAQLGAAIPRPGEFVSIRVTPATESDPNTTSLDGQLWRLADSQDWDGTAAPKLPTTRRQSGL